MSKKPSKKAFICAHLDYYMQDGKLPMVMYHGIINYGRALQLAFESNEGAWLGDAELDDLYKKANVRVQKGKGRGTRTFQPFYRQQATWLLRKSGLAEIDGYQARWKPSEVDPAIIQEYAEKAEERMRAARKIQQKALKKVSAKESVGVESVV